MPKQIKWTNEKVATQLFCLIIQANGKAPAIYHTVLARVEADMAKGV